MCPGSSNLFQGRLCILLCIHTHVVPFCLALPCMQRPRCVSQGCSVPPFPLPGPAEPSPSSHISSSSQGSILSADLKENQLSWSKDCVQPLLCGSEGSEDTRYVLSSTQSPPPRHRRPQPCSPSLTSFAPLCPRQVTGSRIPFPAGQQNAIPEASHKPRWHLDLLCLPWPEGSSLAGLSHRSADPGPAGVCPTLSALKRSKKGLQ